LAASRSTKEDDVLSDTATATRSGVAPHPMPPLTGDAARPQPSVSALLAAILASLDADKAEDVVTIDLAGKSEMADHMVVASGRSSRQVQSIAEKLVAKLKSEYDRVAKVEGKDAGDWVLIDTGDVIVHVFRPEVLDFYQIEKMWAGAAPGAPAEPGAGG
jgi:ribosome-associated protein